MSDLEGAGDFTSGIAYDIAASFSSLGTATDIRMLLDNAGTIITLANSAKHSAYGEAVTFTVIVRASGRVSGQSSPTGVVTFKDGDAVLKTVPLNSGQANFSTSHLRAGTHSITAVYSGDAHYNPHVSAALKQVVAKAASTNTLVSSEPSTSEPHVTFTATVASSTTGTPTGTVAFKDGSTTLGTASLNSGQAVFSTAGLSKGSHAITAVYTGDSNFEGSVSPVPTQVVN